MNYEQFVGSFRNPEKAEQPEGKVVVAGAVILATREYCYIDINGAQYEIAAGDILDIEVISSTGVAKEVGAADVKSPQEAPAQAGTKDVKSPKGAPAQAAAAVEYQSPVVALITLDQNTILCHRVPVGLVTTMGTWMAIVPPTAQPA
jgi:hypothetical protein